jgi:hypothetical protein
MGNRPSSDSAALTATVIARRDELLAQREDLIARRSEIMASLRQTDRDLEDCRATARFFSLQIDFPEDDDRHMSARREHEMRMEREYRNRAAQGGLPLIANRSSSAPGAGTLIEMSSSTRPPVASAANEATASGRPPLREYLLQQLQLLGRAGGKAAGLRALYEQAFATQIHEKTVGMTLYRLFKQGEVHRDGHTWFYGRGLAEPAVPDAGEENED